MADLSERQQARQARFERAIGVAAPFLDLILAVGDRISRAAEPTDYDYYPVREVEGPSVVVPARQPSGERRA